MDFLLGAGPFLYGDEVRARFDLVGFDPRGVLRSTELRCFGTDRQWAPVFAPFAFPMTDAQAAAWHAGELLAVAACDRRAGRILDHMATADVARDLDLLRAAVGDEALTYAGFSYGSFLGVTYANLFPHRVRAVVVDGVIDPVAWTTGEPGEATAVPFSTRLRSDAGARDSLEEFFRLCDAGGSACAFAPDARNRFAAIAAHLRAGNVVTIVGLGGIPRAFDYPGLVARSLGALYDSFSWPSFAVVLARIEAAIATPGPASAAAAGAALDAFHEDAGYASKRGFPRYANFLESFPGVACSDSDNPADWRVWIGAAADAEAGFGYFGPIWTWASSICSDWHASKQGRFAGPFSARTANPVLIANTTFDPATRYGSAQGLASLLPGSRLLTVRGWGHTTPFLSRQADLAVSEYLLRLQLPPVNAVFEADLVPFRDFGLAAAAAAPAEAVAARAGRARLAPALVPDVVRMAAQGQ